MFCHSFTYCLQKFVKHSGKRRNCVEWEKNSNKKKNTKQKNGASFYGCQSNFKAFHSSNSDSTPSRFRCENSVSSMFFEELVFLAFPCSTDWLTYPCFNKFDTVYNLILYNRNELSMNGYDCAAPDTKRHSRFGKKIRRNVLLVQMQWQQTLWKDRLYRRHYLKKNMM